MLEELYVDGMIEIIDNGTTVARVFPYPSTVYVKMMTTGYDFTCDSIITAKQLILVKMGR